jgi:5-methylcytosine-specific restriction endonuclease McrA
MSRKHSYQFEKNKLRYMFSLGLTDGWRCHYCHVELGDVSQHAPNMPTLDHKVAVINGGTDELDNLVLCCSRCNSRKNRHHTYESYLALTALEAQK